MIVDEEYNFLREELDMNRRFVFERPLFIVGATLAAAVPLADKRVFFLLPLPFLAVLLFNLWFTINRLHSSARIIAYIQLVHEGEKKTNWQGWENSLRKYRKWVYDNQKLKDLLENDKEIKQFDSMAYYPPIYYFHLFIGIILVAVIISGLPDLGKIWSKDFQTPDTTLLAINLVAIFGYLTAFIPYRPSKVRHAIEVKRLIWENVFSPTFTTSGEEDKGAVAPSEARNDG